MNNPHHRPPNNDDIAAMLINPFYAIQLDPLLTEEHELLVPEDQWVAANRKLLRELGPETYLRKLLAVLKGDYPRSDT